MECLELVDEDYCIQETFTAPSSRALYSNSIEEWATIHCLREVQDRRLEPKYTAKPPMDFQSSILRAQSKYVKTGREKLEHLVR